MRPVTTQRTRTKLARALALCALLCAPFVALLLAPLSGDCVVKRLAGFACPGCGLGHALAALARLDVLGASRAYPPLLLLALGWLLGLFACARWSAAAWRDAARREGAAGADSPRDARRSAVLRRASALVGVGCAGLVVCNWIITLCA